MNLRTAKIRAAKLAASSLAGLAVREEFTGAHVPVLCYHRVLPELQEGEAPVYTLTPEQFAEQMAFLAVQGFRSLSLDEYASLAAGDTAPPARAVLVTFDDGYADNYHHAWPIAAHYGIKLNLFLCTGLINGDAPTTYGALTSEAQANKKKYPALWQPLTWWEVKWMAQCGVGIGFHSHRHQNYGQITAAEIAADVSMGIGLLDSRAGVQPRAFAFPGGSAGTYNAEVVALLQRYGLELLFTTHLGRTRLGSGASVCSRLVIYQEDNLKIFQRKLFGAYDWLGKARCVDQSLRALWSR